MDIVLMWSECTAQALKVLTYLLILEKINTNFREMLQNQFMIDEYFSSKVRYVMKYKKQPQWVMNLS